jgi:hypothetical protein
MFKTDRVNSNERITRYLFSKKSFRADNSLRHNEFMPPTNLRWSVYRTLTLAEAEIWRIGNVIVSTERKLPLVGRGDLSAEVVLALSLSISPATEPHPLHANVVGWKDDTAKHRLLALKLSEAATGYRTPE